MPPLAQTKPRDPEWEQLLVLASYPLREFDDTGMPIDATSACIVQYRNRCLLLTVYHATGNEGRWDHVGAMARDDLGRQDLLEHGPR